MLVIIYFIALTILTCNLTGQLIAPEIATEITSDHTIENDHENTLQEPIPQQTDEASKKIIANYLKVNGGEAKLRTVTGIHLHGHMREGKREYDVLLWESPKDKIRVEEFTKHLGKEQKIIYGFDGKQSWIYDFTQPKPLPIESNIVRRILRRDTFHGPFIDSEEQGLIFQYRGTAKSRTRSNHLVKMYHPSGATEYFYFDAITFMITRQGWQDNLQGHSITKDAYFTKYKQINGIWFPTNIEFTFDDQVYSTFAVKAYDINPEIDQRIYAMPKIKQRSLALGTFSFKLERPSMAHIAAESMAEKQTFFSEKNKIRYQITSDKSILIEIYQDGKSLPTVRKINKQGDTTYGANTDFPPGEYVFKFTAEEAGTTHVTLKIEND